jgi:hypothetical protein
MAEQEAVNFKVRGSSPRGGAKKCTGGLVPHGHFFVSPCSKPQLLAYIQSSQSSCPQNMFWQKVSAGKLFLPL